MKRFSVIIVVLLLLLICAGCVPGRQPGEIPESQRFYLYSGNSPLSEEQGVYGFIGETSSRNMELFSAIHESLISRRWTSLADGISGYTEYLHDGNDVIIPCALSENIHLADYGIADSSEIAVEKTLMPDLHLAAITVRQMSHFSIVLLFDMQEDGFFAPTSGYVMTSGPSVLSYQFVGNQTVRWLMEERVGVTGTQTYDRFTSFLNVDTNIDAFGYVSLCRLSRDHVYAFEASLGEPFIEFEENGICKIVYSQALALSIGGGGDGPITLKKRRPATIYYDMALGKAYIHGDGKEWFLSGEQIASRSIFALFHDELDALAKGQDAHSIYAQGVLSGESYLSWYIEMRQQPDFIEEDPHYKIAEKDEEGEYYYWVLDGNDHIMHMGWEEAIPDFSYLDQDILQKHTGGGNVSLYRFFDISKGRSSPIYENPALVEQGKIVYMTLDEDQIKLVVRDLFDETAFYQEYIRDFSPVAAAYNDLISARFINEQQLEFVYLAEEQYTETTETIDIGSW